MKTIINTCLASYLAVVGVSLRAAYGFWSESCRRYAASQMEGYPGKNTAEGQDALFRLHERHVQYGQRLFGAKRPMQTATGTRPTERIALVTDVTGSENTRYRLRGALFQQGLWEHGQRYCGAPQ